MQCVSVLVCVSSFFLFCFSEVKLLFIDASDAAAAAGSKEIVLAFFMIIRHHNAIALVVGGRAAGGGKAEKIFIKFFCHFALRLTDPALRVCEPGPVRYQFLGWRRTFHPSLKGKGFCIPP